ncbi:MAG: glutaredoxin family protein [Dehalococcoidia bacterium]
MRLTLYMRPGCHLCSDALEILRRIGWQVDEMNIDEDRELWRRYTDRVPVVTLDGNEILSGAITEGQFRAALAASRVAQPGNR